VRLRANAEGEARRELDRTRAALEAKVGALRRQWQLQPGRGRGRERGRGRLPCLRCASGSAPLGRCAPPGRPVQRGAPQGLGLSVRAIFAGRGRRSARWPAEDEHTALLVCVRASMQECSSRL